MSAEGVACDQSSIIRILWSQAKTFVILPLKEINYGIFTRPIFRPCLDIGYRRCHHGDFQVVEATRRVGLYHRWLSYRPEF